MNKTIKTLFFLILVFLVFYPFIKISQKKTLPKVNIINGEIKQGDILGDILKINGISDYERGMIIKKLKEIFDPRKSKIGDKWEMHFSHDGDFLKFRYFSKPFNYYIVEKQKETGEFITYVEEVERYKKKFLKTGVLNSSLYESMTNLNINPEIIIQFAEIFESKIDFFTDCQNGDKFSLIWESWTDKNNEILKDIRVVAGKYETENQKYYAFYFEKGDFKGFFDENGKGLEGSFLKAPLSYRKITSFFSQSRFHPIYKIYRPHHGIDYSAPIGTPVSSIGNGTIIFVGYLGGYGKCVKIKHSNGYISYYGHLSKFATGIKSGKKVKKGDVIGYVGMTGIATGPHLDFRIQKNGKFINFLNLKFVPEKNIPEKFKEEFENLKNTYLNLLNTSFTS
ncbi:MAG: M23 family metallopeptidase [Candidatus Omnitrophica bacterium]|nr:M23 family metallopeptidase [Candidatus Omnitrophota bacterium]MCM8809067.1 M23 family metallopeptidase [Candidatus Omnitrophota bacterium]MCM8810405.1 M23 family metallopeptidase [Candidatus Omnitrophota bacterium]